MGERPLGSGVLTPVTQTERIDLLFELLQRYLVVVPHTDVLLDGVVISFIFDFFYNESGNSNCKFGCVCSV